MAIDVRAAGAAVQVEARRGDEVTVRLPENPTTGYCWAPGEDHELLASTFEPGAAAAGAAGERVITLIVRQSPGSVTFKLVRSWAPSEAERVFTLVLTPPDDGGG
jgi:predicted secreted protein